MMSHSSGDRVQSSYYAMATWLSFFYISILFLTLWLFEIIIDSVAFFGPSAAIIVFIFTFKHVKAYMIDSDEYDKALKYFQGTSSMITNFWKILILILYFTLCVTSIITAAMYGKLVSLS